MARAALHDSYIDNPKESTGVKPITAISWRLATTTSVLDSADRLTNAEVEAYVQFASRIRRTGR